MNNSVIIGLALVLLIIYVSGFSNTFREGLTPPPKAKAPPNPASKSSAPSAPAALPCKKWCFNGSNASWAGKDEMGLCTASWDSCKGCKQCLASSAPTALASSAPTAAVQECKTITKDNAEKCSAMANAKNRLAAVKKLELDECVKLGASWTSAVTGHYQDPACCDPKTGVCCCLGDNCINIKKCPLPGGQTKPDLPPPITGKKLAQVCKGAPFPAKKGMTLAQRQAALLKKNQNLMNLSNKIYKLIEEIYAERVKIGKYSTGQRQNMNKQLQQYEKIRKELIQQQKEQGSLQAMLTDKKLQTSSTAIHYTLWLILAISGTVIALRQLSR